GAQVPDASSHRTGGKHPRLVLPATAIGWTGGLGRHEPAHHRAAAPSCPHRTGHVPGRHHHPDLLRPHRRRHPRLRHPPRSSRPADPHGRRLMASDFSGDRGREQPVAPEAAAAANAGTAVTADAALNPAVVADAGAAVYVAPAWKMTWWRFRKHKLALVCLWIFGVVALIALAPGFFATQDPNASAAANA